MSLPITIQIYLLAAVVSFAVAGLIHLLVVTLDVTRRRQVTMVSSAPPSVAPQPTSPTAAQVAAISAALNEVLGNYRIVRIETAERGHTWVSGARAAQHDSHHLARSPGRSPSQ
ncbi:hypothetical protein [Niveibacterium sp. COAC-50]|uniref:hypothetical protein n=1 Tax=Niveibacterium sp. COAC-50 TaxID=2729384 RepID=UPI001555EB9A|nr:hypothetical protein [Niveibacterium sp. COAC-50]